VTTVERRSGRSAAIGNGVAWTARWSLRLALIGLGAALLWWLVAQLWVIVMPVLLALLLATVLVPPATWLRKRGLPSALAASVVLLGGLILLGLLVWGLAVSITGGVPEIAASAVDGIEEIQRWITGIVGETQLTNLVQQGIDQLQSQVSNIATTVLTGVSTVASAVITGLLALVLAFLFVKDGPKFLPWVRRLVGPRAGVHLTVVLARVWATLGGFIQAQVLVSLADGILIGIGLLIVGVPLALPLAVLTFIGGFIPIVGALIAGALAVLVALVSNGFTAALIVLGIVLLVQQIEGNVLQPILQARSLNLHAAVVLLAVTAGSSLYGIPGAFLAVPVCAAVAVLVRYLSEQVDIETRDEPEELPDRFAGATRKKSGETTPDTDADGRADADRSEADTAVRE
jgi:putative heme transporter